MVSNICMVGLLDKYTKDVTQHVADMLEMYYTDVTDVMEYDFSDLVKAESIVGRDYIEKQESGVVKTLSSYDNTIFSIKFSILNNETNLGYVKNGCILIYLRLDEAAFNKNISKEPLNRYEKSIAKKLYDERDKILVSYATIVADVSAAEDEVEIILNKIEEYYEKR